MRCLRKTGFTLIELLVVIGIIAILAAILFPVFAQARASARKSVCLSNIKQLSVGMTMYAQDSDEAFPTWHWDVSRDGGTGTPDNDGTTVWWNAIYPYVRNAQVYVCPDNKYDVKTKDDGSWGWFKIAADPNVFARAANIHVELANICIGYGSSEPITYSYPRLASMQRPSETLIVADCYTTLTGWEPNWDRYDPNDKYGFNHMRINRVAYPNGWDQSWFDNATYGPFSSDWDKFARHSGGNNIGYADGHAKYSPASQTTIRLFGLPQ